MDAKMKSRLSDNALGKVERKLKDLSLTIAKNCESVIVKGKERPLEENAEEKFKQIDMKLTEMM